MRKISANYIYPIISKPIKNGIVVLDDENRIIEIIDPKNRFKEIANLEFYGGLIVPGFVDTFCLLAYANFTVKDFTACLYDNFSERITKKIAGLQPDFLSVQRGINHLEAFGTKAVADLFSVDENQAIKQKSKLVFQNFSDASNYYLPNPHRQISDKDIVFINRLILEEIEDLPESYANFCIGTGSLGTHQKLSIFEELKAIQMLLPHLSVWELLKWASLQPAQCLGLESDFGSLEIGKKPGLNLISGIDYAHNTLSAQSELKVII